MKTNNYFKVNNLYFDWKFFCDNLSNVFVNTNFIKVQLYTFLLCQPLHKASDPKLEYSLQQKPPQNNQKPVQVYLVRSLQSVGVVREQADSLIIS